MDNASEFGFKRLNANNWLEPDVAVAGFVRLSPYGQFRPNTAEDYLQDILAPRLIETVPADVQALFEVARGAMLYECFFYPLYALSAEQLFRVAEAAITHKRGVLGAPKQVKTFEQKTKWLSGQEVIAKSALGRWDAIRAFRNLASHPERQLIHIPGNAIGQLEFIAE